MAGIAPIFLAEYAMSTITKKNIDRMRVLFGIGLGLCLLADLRAEQLPSDVDLKAAYCIPIVKHTIGLLTPFGQTGLLSNTDPPQISEAKRLAQKSLAEENEKLRRLQAYILPRIRYIDAFGILAAQKRGEEDVSRWNEVVNICMAKCNNASDPGSCSQLCWGDYDISNRLKTCQNLSWLPF